MTVVLTRGDKFMRRLFMNCNDPSCASVCSVGALQKTTLGPVTYDASKCMICRYCMVAYPFSVPKYEWSNSSLTSEVHYVSRPSAQGKPTASAEICPTGATRFGDRDELIAEAQKRIHDSPGNYVNHILRARGSRRHVGAGRRERDMPRATRQDGKHLKIMFGLGLGIGLFRAASDQLSTAQLISCKDRASPKTEPTQENSARE